MSTSKEFIGKTFEKVWQDGNVTIKLTLSEDDKKALMNKAGDTTIEIKKSKAGKWYSEISQFIPRAQNAPAPAQPLNNTPSNDDLPF